MDSLVFGLQVSLPMLKGWSEKLAGETVMTHSCVLTPPSADTKDISGAICWVHVNIGIHVHGKGCCCVGVVLSSGHGGCSYTQVCGIYGQFSVVTISVGVVRQMYNGHSY